MDSLIEIFADDIDITYKEDHIPLYNGFDTIHEALVECNPLYIQLSFEDQMSVSAKLLNLLTPLDEEIPESSYENHSLTLSNNKQFIYTYEWYARREDYACMVFDVNTGDIIFHEWFQNLYSNEIMKTLEDVGGLLVFLLQHGELIEGDTLIVQGEIYRDDDDTLDT